jgi:hypothetical protein
LADRLLDTGADVWNLYGPTETTIWSALDRVQREDRNPPVGRPIANTWLHILDEKLRPVPVGVSGELLIGGAGLALGYLNQPELSAEKFIPNPLSETREASPLLYRTGDRARWLADGRVECLGRMDHQVKVRGYRIELGEIEAVLVQNPAVRECAVIVREDRPGDKRLVAYLVKNEASAPDAASLREHAEKSLPEYMIPTAWVWLEALPLTPNRKVDRRALPAPQDGEGAVGNDFVAPSTETEKAIAGIWENVLASSPLSANDNFFEKGGHSLLAARALLRINIHFDLQLPLRGLFESPTIMRMARRIDALLWMRHGEDDNSTAANKDGDRDSLEI